MLCRMWRLSLLCHSVSPSAVFLYLISSFPLSVPPPASISHWSTFRSTISLPHRTVNILEHILSILGQESKHSTPRKKEMHVHFCVRFRKSPLVEGAPPRFKGGSTICSLNLDSCEIIKMYQFRRADETSSHTLDGLKQQKGSRGWKSKTNGPREQGMVPVRLLIESFLVSSWLLVVVISLWSSLICNCMTPVCYSFTPQCSVYFCPLFIKSQVEMDGELMLLRQGFITVLDCFVTLATSYFQMKGHIPGTRGQDFKTPCWKAQIHNLEKGLCLDWFRVPRMSHWTCQTA